MLQDELPKQIELLVDSLRKDKDSRLSLGDVASVTEVLIATMQAFFRSIDTSIYRECRALSEYIANARVEIASLQPVDLEDSHIPRAGLELDAIVQQTEEATHTIMEAAEEIMGADPADTDAYQATTQDAVMRIFEACSFQDITGQRISKVVETLSHIENRVLELRDLMGITEDDIRVARENHPEEEKDENKRLLHGPALEGEGIDQSAVDDLMGDDGAETTTPSADADAAAPEEAAAPPAKAETKPNPEPPQEEVSKPVAVDPKQLDAMFEEDFDPVAELEAKKAEEADTAEKPAPAEEPKAEKKEDKKETDLPAGEEVSQDDIDALFG